MYLKIKNNRSLRCPPAVGRSSEEDVELPQSTEGQCNLSSLSSPALCLPQPFRI